MPKRPISKASLIIGAGPIVIGQACEFDYSGVQACKALQGRGLSRHPGQLQPGHHHDRSRAGRCDLYRADHAGHRREDHREGATRRAAADNGRADRAQHSDGACRDGALRAAWRRDDRRQSKRDRQGRGPPAVPRGHGQDRPRNRRTAGWSNPRGGAAARSKRRPAGDHPPVLHAGRHRRRHRL